MSREKGKLKSRTVILYTGMLEIHKNKNNKKFEIEMSMDRKNEDPIQNPKI